MKLMVIRENVNEVLRECLLLIVFFICSLTGNGQTVDWSKTHNWKIYALNNKEAYFYSVDTLANFKSVPINDSTVIFYLSHTAIWPAGKTGTWMGIFIASYETAEKVRRKVVLSSYGGFLFDSGSTRYYELPDELRKEWNEFILGNLKAVFEE